MRPTAMRTVEIAMEAIGERVTSWDASIRDELDSLKVMELLIALDGLVAVRILGNPEVVAADGPLSTFQTLANYIDDQQTTTA